MEFFNWSTLATYAGALAMVIVMTEVTKTLDYIKNIPTQLWSYVIALAVLYPAYYFTGQLTLSAAVLIIFNGMIVALAANGGFEALRKTFPLIFKKQ